MGKDTNDMSSALLNEKQSGFSVMTDLEIKEYAVLHEMISPFCGERCHHKGKLSYGLNSNGYDIRVQNTLYINDNASQNDIIDPCGSLSQNRQAFKQIDTNGYFAMPAGAFVLCYTIEKISLPDHVNVLVIGKSTYARCGIFVNVTSIENGSKSGHIVIEIANLSKNTVILHTGEDSGVCKFLFFKTGSCQNTYQGIYNADRQNLILPGDINIDSD